jgi:hypothetical protein
VVVFAFATSFLWVGVVLATAAAVPATSDFEGVALLLLLAPFVTAILAGLADDIFFGFVAMVEAFDVVVEVAVLVELGCFLCADEDTDVATGVDFFGVTFFVAAAVAVGSFCVTGFIGVCCCCCVGECV